jgi:hypothetical protein
MQWLWLSVTVSVPTLFTIGSSLNICVLIATPHMYVFSQTYYYICVLSFTVYFTLFSIGSSLNIGDRSCASLTIVGILRETDVFVCVCACACACTLVLCVRVSGCFVVASCSSIYSLSVCLSRRLLCLCHLPFCPRCEVYICCATVLLL